MEEITAEALRTQAEEANAALVDEILKKCSTQSAAGKTFAYWHLPITTDQYDLLTSEPKNFVVERGEINVDGQKWQAKISW